MGAEVFGLIGCISLSLSLALPTFFNNNNNNNKRTPTSCLHFLRTVRSSRFYFYLSGAAKIVNYDRDLEGV